MEQVRMQIDQTTIREAGRTLEKRMQEKNLNTYTLGGLAGASQTAISRLINGKLTDPLFATIILVGRALDMTPADMADLYKVYPFAHPRQTHRMQSILLRLENLEGDSQENVVDTLEALVALKERQEQK